MRVPPQDTIIDTTAGTPIILLFNTNMHNGTALIL